MPSGNVPSISSTGGKNMQGLQPQQILATDYRHTNIVFKYLKLIN
jgi:hypothetical protein